MVDGLTSGQRAVNGERIRDLGAAIGHGTSRLNSLRNLVIVVTRENAWQDFIIPDTGERVTYGPDEFMAFVTARPLRGLGESIERLTALCKDEPTARAALDRATSPLADQGTNQWGGGSNTTSTDPDNRGREYTLRRLKRDAPALAERVICGELSANAAAIEAGFRKRDTPLDALRRAWGKATEEERASFRAEIGER